MSGRGQGMWRGARILLSLPGRMVRVSIDARLITAAQPGHTFVARSGGSFVRFPISNDPGSPGLQ